MAAHRNPLLEPRKATSTEARISRPDPTSAHWPGYVRFLFVAGLTLLLILLAVSMQRHHFLDGALDHREQRAADQ
jgi:hypothetical protein